MKKRYKKFFIFFLLAFTFLTTNNNANYRQSDLSINTLCDSQEVINRKSLN